mgnify:CR=1 FL=1
MQNEITATDLAEIEARARVLRAQAARHGLITLRNAIANAVASLLPN